MFAGMRTFASEYLQANIRLDVKFASSFANMRKSMHQIEYLYANLCEYFEVIIKRMMRKNGVCEYTETCEYEANKIHIRLDSLRMWVAIKNEGICR